MKYRESSRFSVGARVRNKNPRSPQFGRVGVVEKIYAGKNPIPFLDVRYDGETILRAENHDSFEPEGKS
jgi:hypothetical protein